MILYTNGCSMTAGEEIGGEERDKRGFKIRDLNPEYKKQNAWPAKLATHLNVDLYNDAVGGASNDRMVRTTIIWTSEYLKKHKPSDLLVIVGWSGPERAEFYINNNWVNLLPNWTPASTSLKKINDFYMEYMCEEEFYIHKTLTNIVSLQSWLKINKIPYLFFNALHVRSKLKTSGIISLTDQIDESRYYKFDDNNWCMYSECESFPRGPRTHPLEEGHQHWADVLFKHINENNLTKANY